MAKADSYIKNMIKVIICLALFYSLAFIKLSVYSTQKRRNALSPSIE